VIGSLFGSNIGAVLYERILKPIVPSPEVVAAGGSLSQSVLNQVKSFWLIFAVLGAVCLCGLLLYNRFFSEETPVANRRAWKIMLGIYSILALGGVYFFIYSIFLAPQIQWKTFVQSLILLGLGGGGIRISTRRSP
jgi:hypothetical protein